MFATLGIAILRYPVLWEQVSPNHPDKRDFSWHDQQLARLRALQVKAVVGLIHHGSGPVYSGLLTESFAPGLAAHARATAERYPWVDAWTPVNEPVTTARFTCLYGLWHPHATSERAFWLALLNQIDATRLAMREIRCVIPAARLVATDDLGFAHAAVSELQGQADYENQRRWIGWDLLAGTVTPDHPLWSRIAAHGFGDRLRAIADDPSPPDVVGINHYLSSERLLDHADRHPGFAGGDGVLCSNRSAAQHAPERLLGPQAMIEQCWARYRRTVAVTEAHNGCTREEQMRWFHRVWMSAVQARRGGADVAAVTAWSLLGAHGWNKLATGDSGQYEAGVFDVRAGRPRATAMVPMLRALAAGSQPPLARIIAGRGWWEPRLGAVPRLQTDAPRILITGRCGTLGGLIAKHCTMRGLAYVATDRRQLAITDPGSMVASLDRLKPWAVINTAGIVDIDMAQRNPELAMAVNGTGATTLAGLCADRGIPFVTISTDQVFDGLKGSAYAENDLVSPINAYGRSKAAGEAGVLARHPAALVVRTAAFFSPHDQANFAVDVVEKLLAGQLVYAADDCWVTPTYVPDLAQAMLDLLIDGEHGIWHLANERRLSWADFARAVAQARNLDTGLIYPVSTADLPQFAPRPSNVALTSERGALLLSFDDALDRFAKHYRSIEVRRRSRNFSDFQRDRVG